MNPFVRLTDEWLPMPAGHLAAHGFQEGQTFELEVLNGCILLTPVDPPDTSRPAPPKTRQIPA
jgi:hypothetical protein